jgi:hypothetical protein
MRWLLSLIVGTCLYLPTLSYTQVTEHRISDDGYARVPLQFAFPYHGRVFTESYMFSNGVVGFLNPTNSWCCSGYDITQPNHPFSFAIMPLQTDLINYGQGRFLTEGTSQYQRYAWENISEYGRPQNLNTFGVEIKPSGYIGIHYEKVNIDPSRTVTIGMTGDSSLNQYTLHYSGAGFRSAENVSYITQSTGDMCLVDPLSSPTCAGYQEAYTTLQCSSNPLYSPTCSGYAAAYLTQQCSLSTLYDPSCPGYEQAYFNQQCGLNALYDTRCTGYSQAYFNQQCSLNPLYDRGCSGYNEAYALANVVTPSAPVVSAPVLQVSTTGTVSIQTPIVSDPVVNEVITRPSNVSTPVQQTNTQSSTTDAKAEPKAEKKTETKQVAKPSRNEVKNEVTQTAPVMVDVPMQTQPLMIVDMLFRNMVKKPIQDNNRSYYALIMGSQKSHEEMVDEQYRK